MAMRRCECGVWFRYDARVRDEALECPACGRILPRSARETWNAGRVGQSLVWIALFAAVLIALGGVTGAYALVNAGEPLAGALVLLGGIFLAGTLALIGATLRALGAAVSRLEDRVP
jgi:hypothetical protein